MPSPRILIVEDEPGIAESLHFLLERDHFAVQHVDTLAAARASLVEPYALMILDLGLPDGSGETLLRELRQSGRELPVIILTSRGEEVDRIVGLELGADDYVTKPFSPREVVARIKAVLRRTDARSVDPVAPADEGRRSAVPHALRIDASRRRVEVAGQAVELTKTEFDLLATLWARRGHVFSRNALLDKIWQDAAVTDRTVDVHIKSLRRKLRDAATRAGLDDQEPIETVRGIGYRARE